MFKLAIEENMNKKIVEDFVRFITSGYDELSFWKLKVIQEEKERIFEFINTRALTEMAFLRGKECDVFISLNPIVLNLEEKKPLCNTLYVSLNIARNLEAKSLLFGLYKKIEEIKLKPSLIVLYRNELHLYYKLKHPITMDDWFALENKLNKIFEIVLQEFDVRLITNPYEIDEEIYVRVVGTFQINGEGKSVMIENYDISYDVEKIVEIYEILSNKTISLYDKKEFEKSKMEKSALKEIGEKEKVFLFKEEKKSDKIISVDMFANEYLNIDHKKITPKDEIYKVYLDYCKEKGMQSCLKSVFFRRLNRKFEIKQRRIKIGNKRVMCVQGICVKGDKMG